MRNLHLAAAGLVLMASMPFAFAAPSGAAVMESKPGAVTVGESIEVTGTIAAIDAETRAVTLAAADGKQTVVTAGPEVRNFDQLKVGDTVSMRFVQALALELKKGSTADVSRVEEGTTARAEPGAAPGAAAGRRVHIVAEVMAVDADTQTVTLRGPERTVDLAVKDSSQFENIAVGDRIEATYVEALAVEVTTAPAPK